MELQEFIIPKYNWDVCAYYYTDGYESISQLKCALLTI